MAPLSVLLALMLAQAHPGSSIISGPPPHGQAAQVAQAADKQAAALQDKDSQSRRIGVGLAVIPGPAVAAEEAKEARAQAELKRGAQLSGQASHIHGTVYGGGDGFGGPGGGGGGGGGGFGGGFGGGGFEQGFGGHHGGSGLGFYGGGLGHSAGGFGGELGGAGLESGLGAGHVDYHHFEHHDSHYHKALAVKSLLVPLAGVALLGAAAAFVTNPILLQLGVISGKRRRRGLASSEDEQRLEQMAVLAKRRVGEIQLLEDFMAQIPRAEARAQEQRLLASYLTCTGIVPQNGSSGGGADGALGSSATCLERLSCELHHNDTVGSDAAADGPGALERHVMRVVTGEILSNEFIPEGVKRSVEKAVLRGRQGDDCGKHYPCQDLDRVD